MSREDLIEHLLELSAASAGESGGKKAVKSREKQDKYTPKTPLGMRDYMPDEMALREKVFEVIKNVFKRHGAVTIETPVAELKETLTGKYGEDSKLIYDLADQGGEILALRYDLTVPFARFCAEHGIDTIKRYHISRVYRRDAPAMTKGRYREFYQCDIDIAGVYEAMAPDAECVKIVSEVLTQLEISPFVVKVNHRKILDGIFEIAGVPLELFRPICSAVDKLDKLPWSDVKAEMLQKGIDEERAEKIWTYVQKKGGPELVQALLQDPGMQACSSAKAGLEDMAKLFEYCQVFQVPPEHVCFDLSMARGLDYYTGVIYECVLQGEEVGSVAGGGRYDELVGMFLEAKAGKKAKEGKRKIIPCVGVSLGIERLFTVVQKKLQAEIAAKPTQVFVAGIPGSAEERPSNMTERMRICSELWAAGIRAETQYKLNVKFVNQMQACESDLIPLSVCIGSSELDAGLVKIMQVPSISAQKAGATRTEEMVPRGQMIERLSRL